MDMQKTDLVIITTITIFIIIHQRDISCAASMQIHHETSTTHNDYIFNELLQERLDQMKIPKDQTLVVRLPSNTLLKYNSYKDVSILHFRIPHDTKRAIFTFKAIEESKSAFQRKCKPRNVSLHLKASSYPVVSPENITFPKTFLNVKQRFKIYNLQFQSDEMQQQITVDGPQIGSWFAVAFLSWTNPNNDRIEQQGLSASCDTLLLAEMSVAYFHPIILNNGQLHNETLTCGSNKQNKTTTNSNSTTQLKQLNRDVVVKKSSNNSTLPDVDKNKMLLEKNTTMQNKLTSTETEMPTPSALSQINENNESSTAVVNNNEIIYKFFVPRNIGIVTARITFGKVCLQCPDVGFHIQTNAFPNIRKKSDNFRESNNIHSTIIKPNQTDEISFEFYVQPNSWHYAVMKFVTQGNMIYNITSGQTEMESLYNEQTQSNNIQQLHRFKSLRNAINDSEANIWYKLSYELQIDYHEGNDKESSKNNQGDKINDVDISETKTNTTQNKRKDSAWAPKKFKDIKFYALLRQTYREFFMYDYDLMPDENGTVPTVLNLTAGVPVGFEFNVGEVYDIGGTLSFAVSMKLGNKASSAESIKVMPSVPTTSDRSGILAEKLIGDANINSSSNNNNEVDKRKLNDRILPRSNQTIIVCMNLGEPGEPVWPDKCRYGSRLLPASSIVNNTGSNTSTGLIHVPFPESGNWYVTMGLYCHGAETASRATIIESVKEFIKHYAHMLENMMEPCTCTLKLSEYRNCINKPKCLSAMSETETLKIKECLMDSKCTSNHEEMTQKFEVHHKFATEQHFAIDNCSTSVVFTISSSPCVAGRCGRYGRCYHYMSGGFVFSTCVCMKGYRGWDCTEDSQVPSSISILMASLLLTLSNLLFFPSIYIASRRQFYTEAVIYFFTMFFSIFYHACDSGEDEYSFCLVKIGVLQFCDFYCGLLAIWVTLIAMSHIRQQFVSLLHMLGAILLAFGTELNKQSLWVFLAPALTGICLISSSWGIRCYKSQKWFPARRYLTVYMPLGTVLVMVGLVCYAFLQTKQNYHIVHSIWHMVMALSILCLLPSRNSFIPKC